MKDYKVGDIVRYIAKDFDGVVKARARIIEVAADRVLAEEMDSMRPMKLYIDDDTDYMFSRGE
ncbi:MAG: hypothetical protein IKN47_07860 [Lachnospiraceae bacterium]|nr:hypothetical protein [Lachnospiraceae bacterium]